MRRHPRPRTGLLATAVAVAATVAATVAAQTPTPTLSLPTSAETAPAAGGFIPRWIILEPIPTEGLTDSAVKAAVGKQHFPDQLGVLPRHGDTVMVDGAPLAWHAVETRLYNVNLFHFARGLGKPTSNVLFWALTMVESPQERAGVRLAIGSNAASVWWLNGQEVVAIYGDRQTVIDDGVSKRLTLKKGRNVLRAAIVNAGGATDFCARFLDADDRPLESFTIRLP
jgi:hypothetical protein